MKEKDKVRKVSIRNWAEDDRPREKLLQKGNTALSDAELIAILIQSGTREQSAVDVAREILKMGNHNLCHLGRLQSRDFQRIKGIGNAKALTLMAALELGRRRQVSEVLIHKDISSSRVAAEMLIPMMSDLRYEKFCVLCLSQSNKLLHCEFVSSGGQTSTVADPKLIFKTAMQHMAGKIIVAHNHPSGSLKPSRQDRQITEQLKEGARLLDIQLADHIIVADKQYLSFADEGLL